MWQRYTHYETTISQDIKVSTRPHCWHLRFNFPFAHKWNKESWLKVNHICWFKCSLVWRENENVFYYQVLKFKLSAKVLWQKSHILILQNLWHFDFNLTITKKKPQMHTTTKTDIAKEYEENLLQNQQCLKTSKCTTRIFDKMKNQVETKHHTNLSNNR